ncbi:hypothetical protein MHYP_G00046400 [Metynnis hypsauchen]
MNEEDAPGISSTLSSIYTIITSRLHHAFFSTQRSYTRPTFPSRNKGEREIFLGTDHCSCVSFLLCGPLIVKFFFLPCWWITSSSEEAPKPTFAPPQRSDLGYYLQTCTQSGLVLILWLICLSWLGVLDLSHFVPCSRWFEFQELWMHLRQASEGKTCLSLIDWILIVPTATKPIALQQQMTSW